MERMIVKAYDAQRKRFGKQPQFSMTKEVMLDSIEVNPADQKKYVLRNPVSRDIQISLPKAEQEINTIRIEFKNSGINHAEGGWPKEVHYNNEEETVRYRRRIEREDQYVRAIMSLTPKVEKFIRQNNAIEIYQQYFKGMEEILSLEKATAKVNNVFRDPDKRPVAGLSWTHEDDPKLAVSYCSKKYPVSGPVNKNLSCYIWELENSHNPASDFLPPAACWDLVCSPINPAIIIGGLEDGRVCVFDLRAETEAVSVSPPHTAHRDPVTQLLYLQSRHSNEFFTGSRDGQCKWYDIRDLSQPLDNLVMSVKVPRGGTANCSNAEGISAIQFDRALPTRFLAGTETGLVLNVNRKGKTYQDKISSIYTAHMGPVRAVHRSPSTTKMFLTCGDWTVHVWNEEIKSSPIITGMMHRYQLMDAVWAPERLSGYMTVSEDGKFRYWDLLRRYRTPVISMRISRYPLLKVVPHEEGRFVVIGSKVGTVSLLSLSKELITSEAKDRSLVLQTFERESRREQILATRLKEIRLKLKSNDDPAGTQTEEELDDEAIIRIAEEEYRREVIDEFRRAGIHTPVTDPMRKR